MSTKERILDIAEHLIGKHGLDDLRLRDIADAIGIRVPSIYGHFESRDAVRFGVVERYVAALADQFPYDGQEEPATALRAGIRKYMAFLAYRPAFVRLELRDLERPDGWHEISVASGGSMEENLRSGPVAPMYARVSAILADGHRSGAFREIGIVEFWRAMIGLSLAGLTWPDQKLLTDDADGPEFERVSAEVEDALLRIVRPG